MPALFLFRHIEAERAEERASIRAAQQFVRSPLRMRHHSQNISFAIGNARDAVERTVGIGRRADLSFFVAITEQDALVAPQFIEIRWRAEIVALAMRDRQI